MSGSRSRDRVVRWFDDNAEAIGCNLGSAASLNGIVGWVPGPDAEAAGTTSQLTIPQGMPAQGEH